jgi:hypothetical protein
LILCQKKKKNSNINTHTYSELVHIHHHVLSSQSSLYRYSEEYYSNITIPAYGQHTRTQLTVLICHPLKELHEKNEII